MNSYENFRVDIKNFDIKRLPGVSGVLRLKNDEEFLESCINSCIHCVDELVVVYEETSDKSLQILQKLEKQYPEKIRVYHYQPKLYVGELNESEYKSAIKEPSDSVHLLANYCNFAFSKIQYRYALKIDTDQVYIETKLKRICDAYRAEPKFGKFNPLDLLSFLVVLFFIFISQKLKLMPSFFLSEGVFNRYFSFLILLIQWKKVPVSLSGINLVIEEKEVLIPLGKNNCNGMNILPPFNGVGDTPLFKLTSQTYFVPWESENYSKRTGKKHLIIERLENVHSLLPVGVCWAHFSAMRKNIKELQKQNIRSFPNHFLSLNKESFSKNKLFRYEKNWETYERLCFRFLPSSINEDVLVWLKGFELIDGYIKRKEPKQ